MKHPGRQESSREADQILEPERLVQELSAKRPQLAGDLVLEEIVAGHDGDWRQALCVPFAELAQESQTVDERHSKIEDNRVRLTVASFPQSRLGAVGRVNLIPFQTKPSCKCLRHAFIVIDDENALTRCFAYFISRGHRPSVYSNRPNGFRDLFAEPRLDRFMLNFTV